MKIKIRKATVVDLEAISRLNKALFNFEDRFGHEYNLDWTYSDKGQEYLKERLANPDSIIFVAEAENKIIGYILAFSRTYSARRINPICEIENMFIKEIYRRHGVGKLLINAVKEQAKIKGVKLLRVGTIAQNTNALHFYKAQGFAEEYLYLETKI